MVQDVDGNFLCDDVVDISILLILIILHVVILLLPVLYFNKYPYVLLVFLLNQTAAVHENNKFLVCSVRLLILFGE